MGANVLEFLLLHGQARRSVSVEEHVRFVPSTEASEPSVEEGAEQTSRGCLHHERGQVENGVRDSATREEVHVLVAEAVTVVREYVVIFGGIFRLHLRTEELHG